MCGICGVYGIDGLTQEDLEAFQSILVNCESRGTDAFGYYAYPNKTLFKIKGSVSEYLKKHKTMFKKWKGAHSIVAHTRATTKGSEDKNQNNHPFETENFVLAHNGTIWNYNKIEHKTDIETDSYVIIHNIEEEYNKYKSIPKAIKTTCEKLEGSYACWLLFKPTGSIYLFRHNNPIEIRYDKERKLILFASENDMMEPLRGKTDIIGFFKSLFTSTIEENKIYRINKDGGLIEVDSFIPSLNCKSLRDYIGNEQDKIPDGISNSDFSAMIFKRTGQSFNNLQNSLDHYGIHALMRNNKIYLYFPTDEIYESYKDVFENSGFTISPATKTLTISNISDLDMIEELAIEGYSELIANEELQWSS